MSGVHIKAWVTTARDDLEVKNALILCYSLRRTCTRRKMVLILSDQLTERHKNAARRAFDFVFTLDNQANTTGMGFSDFAKLCGIGTLTGFEECVFLSPKMLVLKNSDEIFDQHQTSAGICMIEGPLHDSMFVFKPSTERFDELLTFAKGNPGTTFYDLAKNNGVVSYLPPNYGKKIVRGNQLLEFDNSVSIVDLADYPTSKSLKSLEQTGLVAKLVAEHWLRIQAEDVAPLLEGNLATTNLPEIKYLERYSKEDPIAIVGMSCRYPSANNLEEFWDILSKGLDVSRKVPETRWTDVSHGKGGRMRESFKPMNAGFLKAPVDEFDASFFGISPQELVFMDPQNRLLLELVWEALEHACINPQSLYGTLGSVFVGSWQVDYKDILCDAGVGNFYRSYMGTSIGAVAARISFLLGMTGPNVATESGCSGSMVAVHMALKSLRRGETNLALACGVNLLLEPFDADSIPGILSLDGRCRPFSADPDGFGRAEGAGTLVLKRMSDAIKDGDRIWGLIRGSAISLEGMSRSMGTPTLHSESQAMKDALADARVTPDQVSFVEAHGTGTPVGDPVELAAITKVYGSSSTRKEALVIGSVKGNVGHTESCSGITGIMKVVLAMHHDTIPQQVNLAELNPQIKLESIPAVIPLEKMAWKKNPGNPRLAGVSSFGITGTDAHVILEEPPQTPFSNALTVKEEMERPVHLLKLSSKTNEAMDIMLEKYKNALETMEFPLADIAYSANVGRADFPIRATILGKNAHEMAEMIDTKKYLCEDASSASLGKICFLFTGQGSQYPGMTKSLYDHNPVFQSHFDFSAKILQDVYNVDIKTILWSGNKSADDAGISRTIYSQTSIFCVEYALLKLWESWGVKPDYVLGHSLGEFAAAVCTGIIGVEDAIKLVAERSKLIDNLPQGKMLVIKANQSQVDSLLTRFCDGDANKRLDYAAVNSSLQTVVAGDTDQISEFSEFCTQNELKCIVLNATHAFHSKHMDPILGIYRDVATTVKKGSGQKCEYISGVKGDVISVDVIDAQYWVDHTREKVNFLSASKKAVELGCQTFIEIGPQPVLSALTMMNNSETTAIACLPSLKRNAEDWSIILNSLASLYVKGMEIDWKGLDRFYPRQKVQLPTYPFLRKRYWPEMTQTPGDIHPLIGSILPNASSLKLFQSRLNLNSHAYIKDHAIGDMVVFPGAGFLEMCLAAGLATLMNTMKSGRPVKVENLFIEAPLRLDEGKTTVLQTVARLPDSSSGGSESSRNALDITIYQRVEEKWLQHARGTFSPVLQPEDRKFDYNPKDFLDLISQPSETSDFYEQIKSVGLNFGPEFQSLEAVWRSADQSKFVALVKTPEQEEAGHVVHPVTLDAMIQAIFCFTMADKLHKKLYVPVKIGRFVWLSPSKSECKDRYVYVYNVDPAAGNELNSRNYIALLLDACGTVIALMSSVELVATRVKTLESVLTQQTCPLPDLWDLTTRAERGSAHGFHNHKSCCIKEAPVAETSAELPPELQKLDVRINELVYLQILRCFYQCGFQPLLDNATFTTHQLRCELQIGEEHARLFRHFLCILEEEGVLQNVDGVDKWQVVQIPHPLAHVEERLKSPVFMEQLPQSIRFTSLIRKLGENMKAILTGQMQALPFLFPEKSGSKEWSSVDDFYMEHAQVYPAYRVVGHVLRKNLKNCKKEHESRGEKYLLRICEVGAGTGIGTQSMLKVLDELGIEYEYTFTDISPSFFGAAEKKFEKYLDNLTFKTLDLEKDPLEQGFTPAYYDLVLAADVIHATRNLRETFTHVNMILKPGGRLELNEQSKVSRLVLSIFGYLEGFWRYEDTDLRQHSCVLSSNKWVDILDRCGLSAVGTYPSYRDHHVFVSAQKTRDISDVLQSQKLVYPENLRESNSKTWVVFHEEESSLSNFILQNIRTLTNRKLVIVTRGPKYDARVATVNPNVEADFGRLMASLQEMSPVEGVVYCWALNESSVSQEDILKPLLYLSKAVLSTKYLRGLKIVALTSGAAHPENHYPVTHIHSSTVAGFIKSLNSERINLVCRAVDVGEIEEEAELLQIFHELWNLRKEAEVVYRSTTRYVPQVKKLKPSLSSLKFPPGVVDRFRLLLPESKQIEDLQFGALEPFELQEGHVEVQVKATALNFRDVLIVLKPSEDFKKLNKIGYDFSGVVDRVFGVNREGNALPSHIDSHEDDVFGMLDNMTYAEASTIPVVMATCSHCLLNIAKIRATDTVLIHTASGGVGLVAIQICKFVGATVIATAGSKRKQNYLRNLGIQHVFNSRNLEFEREILRVTKGRGVDVVLNSLTSKGFKEATLNCCAKNASFVEISKLNIWTTEQVRELRPDVRYTTYEFNAGDSRKLLSYATKNLLEKGAIRPIPYDRFDVAHIPEALQHLQQARHVGKVVCTMPEQLDNKTEVHIPMFSGNATYLITGGLGGIGFLICKWMLEKGARYVILAGRNPPNNETQEEIQRLKLEHQAHVRAVQVDISNLEACRQLLQDQIPALDYPALRGVFHAAGCLQDALVENQTWTNFEYTFAAKVHGTLNLHELTKDNPKMEYFVLFSSLAAVKGTFGQSNHSAGNNFEDAIAHYRYSLGLPATSINWGQWGEVGVATEYDFPGMKPITNLQGIAALEYALKSQQTQLGVFNIESLSTVLRYYPNVELLFEKGVENNNTTQTPKSTLVLWDERFWQKYDELSSSEDKHCLLEATVKDIVRTILKLKQTDEINSSRDLQEIGVDSLMFVEIRNALQNMLQNKVTLSTTSLQDCRSVHEYVTSLTFLIEGKEAVKKETAVTSEEVVELLKEDCQLPEHIRPKPGQTRVKVEDISVVLLTGVTGTLGPYILKELCNTPQISQVICLVRPTKDKSAEERVKIVLEERGLLSDVDMSRVRAVAGDIASPNLGLEPQTWKELCDRVDAVFHVAAFVSHVELYKKRNSQKDSRAVNIGGMQSILQLASSGEKVKHVYNASTILAATVAKGDDGNLAEEWPMLEDYLENGVTPVAYPNTKFAGDMLLKEAVKRGIPGKSFRFPAIGGDSKTGRFALRQNHLMMRYLFSLKHGVTIDTPFAHRFASGGRLCVDHRKIDAMSRGRGHGI